MMQTPSLTPKKFMTTISLIHLALMSGALFFGLIMYTSITDWDFTTPHPEDVFLFIVPLAALGGIYLGHLLFQKQVRLAATQTTLRGKITGYQTAFLIRMALAEGPAFLAIIAATNTNNLLYLCIGGVLVVYMLLLKPNKERIAGELAFNMTQKSQWERENQEINE